MATILALQPRLEKTENKQQKQRLNGAGEVIIFPGVRYERIPEVSAAITKSSKRKLKSA